MKRIMSRELLEALREAFDIEPDNVRRVVIDIQAGEVPMVHIEQFADERTINVIRELGGVRIERMDKVAAI